MNECPPQQRDHFNKKWIIFIQPLEFSGEQGIFVTVPGSFSDDPCNMVQLNFLTPRKGDSFWVSIMFSWTIRQSLGVLGVWISLCVVLFLWGGKHHRCWRFCAPNVGPFSHQSWWNMMQRKGWKNCFGFWEHLPSKQKWYKNLFGKVQAVWKITPLLPFNKKSEKLWS